MNTVQNPAAERLFKKLSALRATLPTDEREVFDQIIPTEEVTAHALKKGVARGLKRGLKKSPEATAR